MPRAASNPRKESARKYMPMIFGVIIAVSFVSFGLFLPGFGPALPSTPTMYAIMTMIVIIGIATIVYTAARVLAKSSGDMAHGLSFIIAGLILFVGVTVLDFPIHTGLVVAGHTVEFSLLTHTLWHLTELVGVVMMGIGLQRLSKVKTR